MDIMINNPFKEMPQVVFLIYVELSYNQLFNDAVKVGVHPPNSTVKLNDAIEVLRG